MLWAAFPALPAAGFFAAAALRLAGAAALAAQQTPASPTNNAS
jgi:hypothetical protein